MIWRFYDFLIFSSNCGSPAFLKITFQLHRNPTVLIPVVHCTYRYTFMKHNIHTTHTCIYMYDIHVCIHVCIHVYMYIQQHTFILTYNYNTYVYVHGILPGYMWMYVCTCTTYYVILPRISGLCSCSSSTGNSNNR